LIIFHPLLKSENLLASLGVSAKDILFCVCQYHHHLKLSSGKSFHILKFDVMILSALLQLVQ
jgi:hypothetical protein